MSRSVFGPQKLIESILLEQEVKLLTDIEENRRWHLDSPIEELFFDALAWRLRSTGYERFVSYGYGRDYEDPKDLQISVVAQCRVFQNWPIDFVISDMVNGKIGKFAIECDGHDFHERTKEQASRDRSRDRRLQQLGFKIFRFTGSEIYRDPLKCADEVFFAMVYDALDRAPEPEE